MLRSLVRLLFSALFLLPAVTQAQIVQSQDEEPPPSPTPVKVDPVIEKKALDLIQTLSEQVGNLHSTSNRMRAQITVADLLWSRDEKRARALFAAAVTQLVARISDIDYSDPEVYQELNKIYMARNDLVMRIAPHDADLAVAVLRQTRLQPDSAKVRGNFDFQNEANLEMSLANAVLAKDPATALKLARGCLARGVTWNVISFLPQLHQKDQKLSQDLYEELVAQIKNENMSRNMDAANNAFNLLGTFQPP